MRRFLVLILLVVAVVGAAWLGTVLGTGRSTRTVPGSTASSVAPSTTSPFPEPVDDPDDPGPRVVDVPEVPTELVVTPEDDVAAVVGSAPEGATIRFRPGVYREVEIDPRDDQTFLADPGVVFNGSRVLDDFTSTDGVWETSVSITGWPEAEQGEDWGYCADDRPMCVHPEDLFVDGFPIRRVEQESSVGPGTWFFDYEGGRVVMGDDPTGHTVEIGAARWAFHGSSDRVEIRGFEIIQYANPGRQGAINPRIGRTGPAGRSWIIVGNTIRFAHGWAIKVEDDMVITDNRLIGGGQGGIGGVGDRLEIEHNLMDDNCTAGFQCLGWEGGALKLSTSASTIRANLVTDTLGHGIHTDIDCVDVVIEDNVVTDNQGVGIHHEISGRAVIRNNTVSRNGFRPDSVVDAGIFVLNSSEVLVENNGLDGNANGIILRQDHRTSEGKLDDVTVRGNTIEMPTGARSGYSFSSRAPLASLETVSLVFEANTYTLEPDSESFQADDDLLTFQAWQEAGFDSTSTLEISG